MLPYLISILLLLPRTWQVEEDELHRASSAFRTALPCCSPLRLHPVIDLTMKLSAAIALAAVGGSSAYSVNRSTLRSLGQKNVAATSQRNVRTNDIKMEGERILCVFNIIFFIIT